MLHSCVIFNSYTQVVNLSALSPIQLQKVYVKFTKELYILSKLQHPRIVTVYGCATTVEELTLVMEVRTQYKYFTVLVIMFAYVLSTSHCSHVLCTACLVSAYSAHRGARYALHVHVLGLFVC
jgi:Protein tyrosine and serine/threonine kinase